MTMPIPTMPAPAMPAPTSKPPRPTTIDGKPPDPRRVFAPGAKPMSKAEQFVSLDGSVHIARCRYNGVWLTSAPQETAEDALDNLQQFYMRETAQGKKDSIQK